MPSPRSPPGVLPPGTPLDSSQQPGEISNQRAPDLVSNNSLSSSIGEEAAKQAVVASPDLVDVEKGDAAGSEAAEIPVADFGPMPPEAEYVNPSWAELAKQWFIMGWIGFGGPAAHIGLFQRTFVERLRWMSNQVFMELFSLGQCLPGPTSTQVSFAIGIVKKGALGGLMTGALFQYPGAIIMTVVGAGAAEFLVNPPGWLSGLVAGVSAVGVAMVATASKGLLMKLCNTMLLAIVATLSAGAAIYWVEPWLYPLLIFIGFVVTNVSSRMEESGMNARIADAWERFAARFSAARRKQLLAKKAAAAAAAESASGTMLPRPGSAGGAVAPAAPAAVTKTDEAADGGINSLGMGRKAGMGLVVAWLTILIVVLVLARTKYNKGNGPLNWFEVFYRIGSIIYGGGQVVLPMLYGDVVQRDENGNDLKDSWITTEQFFAGLGAVQAMPGPLFNFSSYLGCIIAINRGYPFILGAVLAWFGLFAPGVMLMFGVLPFWKRFRNWQFYRRGLPGMNAVGVGLILASVFQMVVSVYEISPFKTASLCIGLFAFTAVDQLHIFEPFVVIGGIVLGIIAWAGDLK